MSGNFGRKRVAENQLTKDDDGDGDYDARNDRDAEVFATTPQIADAAELATRRMVRVSRPTVNTATTGGSSGGLFKNLAAAPAFPSAAGAKQPGFGFTSSLSAPKFSFGPAPEANKDAAPAAPSSIPATTAPTPAFTFNTAAPAAEDKSGEKKPVFGGFSFASAVTSFTEARQNMEATRKDEAKSSPAEATKEGGEAGENVEGDDEAPNVFNAQSVVVSAGEVLASAPAKLFSFEKDGGKWVTTGEGVAKIKKEGDDIYRLLVRDGYTLNAKLGKKLVVLGKEAEKHIIFSTADKDAALTTYLLKFTGDSAESNAKTFIAELKKAIDAGSDSA